MESAAKQAYETTNYNDHDLMVRTVTLLEVVSTNLDSMRSDHERRIRALERWVFMMFGAAAVLDFVLQLYFKH